MDNVDENICESLDELNIGEFCSGLTNKLREENIIHYVISYVMWWTHLNSLGDLCDIRILHL